jgi:long-subunit fatty acid transport protein
VLDENKRIRSDLRTAFNYRGGAELDIEFIGLRVRGGIIYNQSPYKTDPPEYDQKYITAGLGIRLGEPAMLDVAYARGWWTTSHINNDSLSPVYEDITTQNFLLTLSVRF